MLELYLKLVSQTKTQVKVYFYIKNNNFYDYSYRFTTFIDEFQ